MTIDRLDLAHLDACAPLPDGTPPGEVVAVTVRPAMTSQDLAATTELLLEYARWICTEAGFDPLVEQPAFATELGAVAEHYGGHGATMFLARLGGRAVGTLAVVWPDDGTAELKRMYLRPEARGRGLADRLLTTAIAAATARGCRTVRLESVQGAMDAAIAVYRRNGFTTVRSGGSIDVAGTLTMEHQIR